MLNLLNVLGHFIIKIIEWSGNCSVTGDIVLACV